MKITPVSINYNYGKTNKNINKNKNLSPSFDGLWGKTTFRADFEPVMSIPKIETIYYYYPFLNETEDEVRKIVDENSDAKIVDGSKYIVRECKQGYTMPFTEEQYKEYMQVGERTEITGLMRTIHKNVIDKYTTNDYAENQKSAASEMVERRYFQTRFV